MMDVISRYGIPQSVRLDRAKAWLSTLFQNLCKRMNIKMKVTSSYLPRSDGQVERANQMLLAGLRARLSLEQDWVISLNYILMSIRAAVSGTTGMSPFEMSMGRKMI